MKNKTAGVCEINCFHSFRAKRQWKVTENTDVPSEIIKEKKDVSSLDTDRIHE